MVDSIGTSSALKAVSAVSLNSSNSSGDANSVQTAIPAADEKTKTASVSSVTDTSSTESTSVSTDSSKSKEKSTTSSAVSFAEAIAVAGPPVNKAKIQAIRALISEGRYPISASAIASKMVQYETADSTSSASSVTASASTDSNE